MWYNTPGGIKPLKYEQAHPIALSWFQGKENPAEGATSLAQIRVQEFGICSEVIIQAYVDYLMTSDKD